jgi:hypothetical protein
MDEVSFVKNFVKIFFLNKKREIEKKLELKKN